MHALTLLTIHNDLQKGGPVFNLKQTHLVSLDTGDYNREDDITTKIEPNDFPGSSETIID